MTRIYISGPISNMPDLNRPAFSHAAQSLRASGYEVVNPFDVCPAPASWEEAMRADIKAMLDCDAIGLLPGYARSRGAMLELQIAEALGMKVMRITATECGAVGDFA
jgi:hypothetical protein